jgi:hypothetical protein
VKRAAPCRKHEAALAPTTFPPGTEDAHPIKEVLALLGEYALALLLGPVGAGGKLAGTSGGWEGTQLKKSLAIKGEVDSSGSACLLRQGESGHWQNRVSLV